MTSHRRLTATHDQPLLVYLLDQLELKRGMVKNLLKHGAVSVNGTTVRQFDHPLSPGDEVTVGNLQSAVATTRLKQARIQLVYEDDSLLVVEKPAGLLTVATDREKLDTLFVRLNEYLQKRDSAESTRAHVVHRLDQDTSGLVLFAKSESVKRQLQAAWPTVEKTYSAVVRGRPESDTGTIQNYLIEDIKSLKVYASVRPVRSSRMAITHFRVINSQDDVSLVEVRLETGRKHQIRVHLAGLGCPVIGDRRYGTNRDAAPRLALHASGLVVPHPLTGELVSLTSPLPKPLKDLIS